MRRITLDTNVLPNPELVQIATAAGHELRVTSVSVRELEGTSFAAHLPSSRPVPESAIWGESKWGQAVWAKQDSAFEEILGILTNGSFPRSRQSLSAGERRQLRDAMVLEAHVREGREVFVTLDAAGFIKHGRREAIERRFAIEVLSPDEYIDRYREHSTHPEA